ncbi:MAG: SGNH/GDSL hydrolase family protein [Lachnospiraceae bacterium]|nr:SGNH/GDSL hydrolase family protein [Lachnospiraceae bacterium]
MKNRNKKITGVIIGVSCTVAAVTAWIAFCGYQWSWGPFNKLHDIKTSNLPGNAKQYDLKQAMYVENSPLGGKRIVFLGSSVTYGASSKGVSFADYISVRNNCEIIKEAVSGTTLVDNGRSSYISRLKEIDKDVVVDLFVCQLSTNDATQNKSLGNVSESMDLADFDTSTVAGAIEYIIAYAKQTWNCPVLFYTNPQYDSEQYEAMVELLQQIAEKWDITVIDMWNDAEFNFLTEEQRALYMADGIHPTQAGYLEWWTPYIEKYLIEEVK